MIETAFYGDNDHNIIEALNSLQDQIEELKKEIRRLKEERVS
jgi:prefoldin subunit 5